MNTEVSSGGIVVYKANDGWCVLLMKDMKHNWTFPKGKIEHGENLRDTATREIEEEVGVKRLAYIAELTPTTYWYTRGTSIKKTVHYFLFRSKTLQKLRVQTEEGISEAKWVLWKEAAAMIGYSKTNIPLLKEAYKKLKNGKPA